MRARRIPALAACLTCAVVAGGAPSPQLAPGADFIRLTPEQIRWQDLPHGHGAQLATIAGDPSGNGLYVQRVRFPPHVMDRPHRHPHDRHVTVIQGTWFTGTGSTFDPKQAVPLKAGTGATAPAVVSTASVRLTFKTRVRLRATLGQAQVGTCYAAGLSNTILS